MPDERRPPRSRPGRPKPGQKEAEDRPAIRRVGEPKGEHQTRSSRRVRCTRCGKVEHVQGRARHKDQVLCSTCAEEVLGIYEAGVAAKRQMREAVCAQCGVDFSLPAHIEADEVLCRDCLRGFTSWQGKIDRPATRERELGQQRRPGVRLRRRGEEGGSSSSSEARSDPPDEPEAG